MEVIAELTASMWLLCVFRLS